MSHPRFEAFLAHSMDGYIAGLEHSLEWLDQANAQVPPGQDGGYAQFTADVDLILMGSQTYRTVSQFEPWPYTLPVAVLSRNPQDLPPTPPHVEIWNMDLDQAIATCRQRNLHKVYVDGGALVRSFLRKQALHAMTLTQIPVLLGQGIPLFDHTLPKSHWHATQVQHFPFGYIQIRWESKAIELSLQDDPAGAHT